MVRLNIFTYLVLLLIAFGCSAPGEKIIHEFDHGSLGKVKEIEPNYFKADTRHWLKRDSIGDQYYWFYFKAMQVKDQTITFELNDLKGVYRNNPHLVYTDYTRPVYSYDQQIWHRIRDTDYDSAQHTFYFTQKFNQEPVWIAYAHPYPFSRTKDLIASLKDNPFVSLESLAETIDGRSIEMISITDPDTGNDDKKTILIIALQHAGEDAGAYMAEGLIKFLLSDTQQAVEARKKFVYNVIPMMNPDGVYHGTTRYNLQMEDLNNIWLDNSRAQPEVTGVKNWVTRHYDSGNRIDLFIDVHNHSQFHTNNVFVFHDHSLDDLIPVMNNYWPIRVWHSEFEGSSCSWFDNNEIPNGTIELTQSRVDDGDYLTVNDYYKYGEGTVKALSEYYFGE